MPKINYREVCFRDHVDSIGGIPGFKIEREPHNDIYFHIVNEAGEHVATINKDFAWVWKPEALDAITRVAVDFEQKFKPEDAVEINCGFEKPTA